MASHRLPLRHYRWWNDRKAGAEGVEKSDVVLLRHKRAKSREYPSCIIARIIYPWVS
jgi:hypothetical protein